MRPPCQAGGRNTQFTRDNMITAALDTSFGMAFAVQEDGRLVGHAQQPFRGRHTDEDMAPWIHELLADAGLSLSAVVRWTVGIGPGSFTGIRIGVAFVKGVCMQTGAAYRGIPTSLALARAVSEGLKVGDQIAVLHDARRGQLICSRYAVQTHCRLEETTPAAVLDGEEIENICANAARLVTNQPDRVTPIMAPSLRNRLTAMDHVPARLLLDPPGYPWPATLSAQENTCEPVYVRPAVFVKPRQPHAIS